MSIETIPQDMRATSMGAYQALYALGIFGGPLAAGFFNDWLRLRTGFYFAEALGLVTVILAHIWEPMRKNRRKSAGKMRQSIISHEFFICARFHWIKCRKAAILFGVIDGLLLII